MIVRKDPLSHAQETLEAYLAAAPCVVATMKAAVKNIDGYTKLRGTKQQDVTSETDLPALKLIPTGGPCNVNFASNATQLDYTLQVALRTGDQRYNAVAGPLVWAIYAAMTAAIDDGQLVGLTLAKCLPETADAGLRNYEFIKNLTLANIATGFSDPSDPRTRGIVGFNALLDLTLHMIFPRTFVKDWAAQTL